MNRADSEASADAEIRTSLLPSMLTNSLRVVFEMFGEDIIQLRARGSLETTNTTGLDDFREYGASWHQQDQQRVTIDYTQITQSGEPMNPLTESVRTQLLEEVDARLAPHDGDVDPDLAVTELTIRITDDHLQEVTYAQSSEFDLHFVSDPAEPPVREMTKRRNAGRNLYSELGFKLRNLNLRSVIETETKFHRQSDGKYLSWGGPKDLNPQSPKQLAVRVNDRIIPDEYGILKPYVVTDDRVLELSDDIEEPREPSNPPGSIGGDR